MGSSIGDEVSRCYVDMMLRGYANALLLNIVIASRGVDLVYTTRKELSCSLHG